MHIFRSPTLFTYFQPGVSMSESVVYSSYFFFNFALFLGVFRKTAQELPKLGVNAYTIPYLMLMYNSRQFDQSKVIFTILLDSAVNERVESQKSTNSKSFRYLAATYPAKLRGEKHKTTIIYQTKSRFIRSIILSPGQYFVSTLPTFFTASNSSFHCWCPTQFASNP